jgi:hypothetical protein
MKTLLCNLYAGPGTGKSSTMAGVFSELKWRGVNCEMAPEFAKEKVWEESTAILGNQIYVFGKQLHTIYRLEGKVDVIITDSPLLLSIIYGKNEGEPFKNLVFDVYKRFWNLDIFLRRHKKFNPSGRLQTEDEAKEIDRRLEQLLISAKRQFTAYDSGKETVQKITEQIMGIIGKDKEQFK